MRYTHIPKGVCSEEIQFDLDENGTISNIVFTDGCNGNLQGIAKLAEGQNAADVAARLRGINCGGKGTSCPDQFAIAIDKTLAGNLK